MIPTHRRAAFVLVGLVTILVTGLRATDRSAGSRLLEPGVTVDPDVPAELHDPVLLDGLTRQVESHLPPGWVVSRVTVGCTPPDWHTLRPRAGLLVEARGVKDWLRLWFLPRDWIGIRKENHAACRGCDWHGILKTDRHTILTHASGDRHHEAAAQWFGGSTPSLCNGGWGQAEDLFKGRMSEADGTARSLIRRHCDTRRALAEAAISLVELGIPARSVMLRAVRELAFEDIQSGLAKDGFYSVLGAIGDDECIECLCDQLEASGSKYVVYSLPDRDHRRIGPALRKGLQVTDYDENLAAIAHELADRQYRPAGPDLLRALDLIENDYYKADVAAALATLRYKEAVPKLRELARAVETKHDQFGKNEEIRLALSRLVDDWGDPDAPRRHYLEAPKSVRVGEAIVLRMHRESNVPGWTGAWRNPERRLFVDGRLLIPPPKEIWHDLGGGLMASTPRGHVESASYDLARHLARSGTYKIQMGKPGDTESSNVITIEVRP